jgi:hypothetical protein
MRSVFPVGAVVGAALLTVSSPLSAQAATGNLNWVEESGKAHSISAPGDGSCVTFADDRGAPVIAAHLVNETDRPVEVYESPECGGPGIFTVGPKEEFPGDGARSVKIWQSNERP